VKAIARPLDHPLGSPPRFGKGEIAPAKPGLIESMAPGIIQPSRCYEADADEASRRSTDDPRSAVGSGADHRRSPDGKTAISPSTRSSTRKGEGRCLRLRGDRSEISLGGQRWWDVLREAGALDLHRGGPPAPRNLPLFISGPYTGAAIA